MKSSSLLLTIAIVAPPAVFAGGGDGGGSDSGGAVAGRIGRRSVTLAISQIPVSSGSVSLMEDRRRRFGLRARRHRSERAHREGKLHAVIAAFVSFATSASIVRHVPRLEVAAISHSCAATAETSCDQPSVVSKGTT